MSVANRADPCEIDLTRELVIDLIRCVVFVLEGVALRVQHQQPNLEDTQLNFALFSIAFL